MRDPSDGPGTTLPYQKGQVVEGSICPLKDQDWYAIDLGSGESIVEVSLEMSTTRSPVQPTYAIYGTDGSGQPTMSVAAPNDKDVGKPLHNTHRLDPGKYLLLVRDLGDDGQDRRNHYRLTITTSGDSDKQEPNNSATMATNVGSGMMLQAYISYVGDEDWYSVTVPPNSVIQVVLRTEIAMYQPDVRIMDATGQQVLAEGKAVRASMEASTITLFYVAPPGTYKVVVTDDDGRNADASVGYSLDIATIPDADTHEMNDDVTHATQLPMASCGGSWTDVISDSATIGAPGDLDWFRVPYGCSRGLIQVEMAFPAGMEKQVQASITLVRAHPGSACSSNSQCDTINIDCDDQKNIWQCEGFSNLCNEPLGKCSGTTICLPDDGGGRKCGANEAIRSDRTTTNRAFLVAPLLGNSPVYVRLADFNNDGGSPAARYSFRIRVQSDPDGGEPNGPYSGLLHTCIPTPPPQCVITDEDFDFDKNPELPKIGEMRATDINVQGAGGCGSMSNWTQGTISYDGDLDWYHYASPCPGSDCSLEFHYQIDSGPVVDHLFTVYENENRFLGWDADSGSSGSFGGRGAKDCGYAYRSHSDYYMLVMDKRAFNYDPAQNQHYRFCIEEISSNCVCPCQVYPATPGPVGCGPPGGGTGAPCVN